MKESCEASALPADREGTLPSAKEAEEACGESALLATGGRDTLLGKRSRAAERAEEACGESALPIT